MSDPVSLRNIPPDALKLAHTLSAQTGLSLNAVFRLALASGLLVEATKVTPGPDGKLAGWWGSGAVGRSSWRVASSSVATWLLLFSQKGSYKKRLRPL